MVNKRVLPAIVGALAINLAAAVAPGGSPAPDAGYEEVKDWLKLPPGLELGEVPGVDVDSHGHVFIFHRPGRGFEPDATEPLKAAAMVVADGATGRVIATWGANTFLVPHGVSVDD